MKEEVMLAVLLFVFGVLVVAAGLALSPVPWVALLWVGGVAVAAGLLGNFDRETP